MHRALAADEAATVIARYRARIPGLMAEEARLTLVVDRGDAAVRRPCRRGE
jgi:hypothetical protein